MKKSRRAVTRGGAVMVAFIALIFTYAVFSDQYRLARAQLSAPALASRLGDLRVVLLTAFRLTGMEGGASTFTFLVIGKLDWGLVQASIANLPHGVRTIEALSFNGKSVLAVDAAPLSQELPSGSSPVPR